MASPFFAASVFPVNQEPIPASQRHSSVVAITPIYVKDSAAQVAPELWDKWTGVFPGRRLRVSAQGVLAGSTCQEGARWIGQVPKRSVGWRCV